MPPALGRFSTTMVWPRGLPIACAVTRATVSVGPPAAKGTSMLMFLVGYCWADAADANAQSSAAGSHCFFMMRRSWLWDYRVNKSEAGKVLARPAGFEPTTLGFGGQYSDPLSYGRL